MALGSFFYNTPNSILLLVFVVVLVSLALICLYLFTVIIGDDFVKRFENTNTATYIGVLSIAVALVITFVITDQWGNYSQTQDDTVTEANVLYILVQTLSPLPDTLEIRQMIADYLCSIVDTEFPLMTEGQPVPDNIYLDTLQTQIYEYNPQTRRDEILYNNAIALLNEAIFLRNKRLEVASGNSIPPELWWILLLGFVLLVIMTWFITGDEIYRALMTIFIVTIYAGLLFLAVILDFAFRGSFGIGPDPYVFALQKLGATCSAVPQIPRDESIKIFLQEKIVSDKNSMDRQSKIDDISTSAPITTNPWFRSKK